ncbi:MAG: hypothetical protein L0154_01465 [Chloroflexi bacterium]|nr:hypothetical protein [Chloroflexota bacterium]
MTTKDISNIHVLDDYSALPAQPAFAPGSEKLVRLGNIAVVRAGWGHAIDNQSLIDFYVRRGFDAQEVEDTISGTGFEQGYYFPFEQDLFSDKTQQWHVQYAAMLAECVLKARGWDSIDVLIIGSSTTHVNAVGQTANLLRERGIAVGESRMYIHACNSALAGITDLCRQEQYHGVRAVVVGLDTLSGNIVDTDTITTFRVFANGGGAIAFIPGKEIQHIHGRTIAEYDTEGVIVGPQACPVVTLPDRQPHLPWYELVGEETDEKFVTSKKGVFMEIPPSPDGKLYMNGMSTLSYFAKRVVPLAIDVIGTYEREYRDQYGELGVPFGHQPSFPVVKFINNDLMRFDLEARGVDPKVARRLAKRGSNEEIAQEIGVDNYNPLQIPWIMNRTGFNNISAGTSLVAMVTMIEDGLMKPKGVLPVFGYGIGSVIQADIWKFDA